jgi:hypothetical protein
MNRRLRVSPSVALTLFIASAVLVGWSLQRALLTDALPGPARVSPIPGSTTVDPPVPLATATLAAAVGKDPFHPERRRPSLRFRFPGEGSPSTATEATPATAAFKLIGTATMPEGRSFAMCQWGAEPPKLVRIGESVGNLTLKKVEPGRAVFLTAGGKRFEVQVPKAGS